MDERVLEVGPPLPWFTEVRKEHSKSNNIWVMKCGHGVFVSRSAPAIARALKAKGFDMWPSLVYRGKGRTAVSSRCKDAAELNAALKGVESATFIVIDPNAWVCEEKNEGENAAIVSGDDGE